MVIINKDHGFKGTDGQKVIWCAQQPQPAHVQPTTAGHLRPFYAGSTFVTRASFAKIRTHRARMGWTFPWQSWQDSDFNYDFHVTIPCRTLWSCAT